MMTRCFEDQERISEEIKSLFFKTLYMWTAAYVSHLTISYSHFHIFLALSSYVFSFVYFLWT
jgi:hypothetical protein